VGRGVAYRHLMMASHDGEPGTQNPRSGSGSFSWFVTNPLGSLTVIGLLLYGLLRFSHWLFFSNLGSSPEEVGLSYQSILASTLLGVLTVAVSFTLLIVAYVASSFVYIELVRRSPPLQRVVRGLARNLKPLSSISGVTSAFLELVLLTLLNTLGMGSGRTSELSDAGETEKQQVGNSVSAESPQKEVSAEPSASSSAPPFRPVLAIVGDVRERIASGARTVAALFVVLTLIVILVLLPLGARSLSRDAWEGRAVHSLTIGPLTLLAIRALPSEVQYLDAVEATSRGSGDIADSLGDRCLMYLGEASGTTVLFDPEEKVTLRIPSSGVVIRSDVREDAQCSIPE
jgi:hypothetical protein